MIKVDFEELVRNADVDDAKAAVDRVFADADTETIADACDTLGRIWIVPDPNKFHKYKSFMSNSKEGVVCDVPVIDLDKPIAWNIEEAERRNAAFDAEVARIREVKTAISNLLEAKLRKCLMSCYPSLSEPEYNLIYTYVYNEGHSDGMYGVIDKFYEVADLYEELLEARNN